MKRGKLTFILVRGIGQAFVAPDVDPAQVRDVPGARHCPDELRPYADDRDRHQPAARSLPARRQRVLRRGGVRAGEEPRLPHQRHGGGEPLRRTPGAADQWATSRPISPAASSASRWPRSVSAGSASRRCRRCSTPMLDAARHVRGRRCTSRRSWSASWSSRRCTSWSASRCRRHWRSASRSRSRSGSPIRCTSPTCCSIR